MTFKNQIVQKVYNGRNSSLPSPGNCSLLLQDVHFTWFLVSVLPVEIAESLHDIPHCHLYFHGFCLDLLSVF